MCSHAACYKGKGPVLCGPARGQRRLPGGDSVTTETLRMSRSYQVRGLEEGERMEKPMDRGPAWARQDSSRSQGWRGSREGTGGASFRSRQPLWVIAHHDRPAEGWDGVPPLSR